MTLPAKKHPGMLVASLKHDPSVNAPQTPRNQSRLSPRRSQDREMLLEHASGASESKDRRGAISSASVSNATRRRCPSKSLAPRDHEHIHNIRCPSLQEVGAGHG